jgi:4-amino-4-deoxy-L-arabinose transferase-like glycosyltransferase
MFKNRLMRFLRSPIFLIAIITTILTLFLLEKQFFIGVPYYDVYVYLNNSLLYAGIPVGNLSVIYLSPLMPFLTSLVFRMGYISAYVLFLLDGFIFIMGAVFLYLLLKERFNTPASFAGVLIYLSYPLTMGWAVSGSIDFPGVSISILAIYILVRGIKHDSKLIYLVFPLVMLAFLARYTSLVLIVPVILFLLINQSRAENIKRIGVGVLAGLTVIIPFLLYIINKLGNLYPLINIFTSTLMGSGATVNDLGYNPLKLYFLNNLMNYISVSPLTGIYGIIQSPSRGDPSLLAYLIGVLVVFGLSMYVYPGLKNRLKISKISRVTKTKLLILLILLILGVYSFFNSSYLIAELIFLAILYTLYHLVKNDNMNQKLDILFLSWLGAFFIFHSIIPLKDDRYFITMLPTLTYFIILGLNTFIDKLNIKFNKIKFTNENIKTAFLLGIGFLLLSYSTATLTGHVSQEGYGFYIQSGCGWLKEYDPHFQDKVIYSNYDPAVTWCLKKEVKFGVPRLYVDLEAFSNYLKGGGADYYIDAYSTNPPIPGYHIIFSRETVTIYQKDS